MDARLKSRRRRHGHGFGMCGTAGVNTGGGSAARPKHARICASRRRPIHSRLTPRPRVLAPAAAHEGPARPPQVALRTQEVVTS
jgi:hypothetical protein